MKSEKRGITYSLQGLFSSIVSITQSTGASIFSAISLPKELLPPYVVTFSCVLLLVIFGGAEFDDWSIDDIQSSNVESEVISVGLTLLELLFIGSPFTVP